MDQYPILIKSFHPCGARFIVHCTALGVLGVSACSLLKDKSTYHTDSLSRRRTEFEQRKTMNTQLHTVRIRNTSDSMNLQFITEIFPDGPFSYSPVSGFVGKAKRVVIAGSAKHVQTTTGAGQTSVRTTSVKNLEETNHAITRTQTKDKQANGKSPALVLLITGMLVFLVIFIWRNSRHY